MRLIDADKLLEGEHFILKCKSEFGVVEMDVFRREVIDNAPTVDTYTEDDVQYAIKEGHQVGYEMAKAKFERPQGEWIDEDDSYYANCSNCGYQINTHHERGYLNFCPNCGAKMTKEAEND